MTEFDKQWKEEFSRTKLQLGLTWKDYEHDKESWKSTLEWVLRDLAYWRDFAIKYYMWQKPVHKISWSALEWVVQTFTDNLSSKNIPGIDVEKALKKELENLI